jgi:EAL and modified HD-GYP domain-containing signal transduction protein
MTHKDVLLARQPIYDVHKNIKAYELLFRDSDENQAVISCDSSATSNVLLNLFTESDLENVTNGLPAYINFSEELLSAPPLFDPSKIVIEILEGVKITPDVVKQIIKLKKLGYQIALDDFVMDPKYRPLMPYVDIVKVELPAIPKDELPGVLAYLNQFELTLLAEKVETHEEYANCLNLGFQLFQGYFLSKPEMVHGNKLGANQLSVLELITELQRPNAEIKDLTQIISKDPALSYKLLKLINSAAFQRVRTIDSIHMAVALLGITHVKSWASLLALSSLDSKPDALQYIAFVRALTCEKIASRIHPEKSDQFYTIGLLSCLDAFFDQSLETILESLPIEESMRAALLQRQGLGGLILDTTILFEQAQLEQINWVELEQHNLSPQDINDIYYDASAIALNV